MKKVVLIVVSIAILVVLGLNFSKESSSAVISDTVTVTLFESDGELNTFALVSIPFLQAVPNAHVSIAFDGVTEEVVSNVPLDAAENWNSGFYFELPEDEELTSGKVTVNGTEYPVSVITKTQVFEALIDLSKVTDPEEATLGLGARIANAQETHVVYEDVPDISQRPGECVPTAVANNMIYLTNKHGSEDQKFTDERALVEDLKQHMNWSPENGVPSSDIVAGKNAWAKARGLPIETTKVGDTNGITTMEAIKTALENGDAVELRIKFAGGDGLEGKGGHLVSVTGINIENGVTHLAINDPYTEDIGSEIIQIRSNQVLGYGPWSGITGLSWGFVQHWNNDAVTEGTSGISVEEEESATEVFRASVQNSHESTFAHVAPGEYSEIYSTVVTTPLNEVKFKLTGPGVMSPKNEVVIVADENGVANMTWKINLFGSYDATATIEGEEKARVNVVTVN